MSFPVLVVSEKADGCEEAKVKRGGARIIYLYVPVNGLIWLLTIYAKSNRENIPSHILKALKEELFNGHE